MNRNPLGIIYVDNYHAVFAVDGKPVARRITLFALVEDNGGFRKTTGIIKDGKEDIDVEEEWNFIGYMNPSQSLKEFAEKAKSFAQLYKIRSKGCKRAKDQPDLNEIAKLEMHGVSCLD